MKNFHITKYIMIGLSTLSLSLSGMRVGDSELVIQNTIDHTITFKPIGGYFELTPQNKDRIENTLKQFNIPFDNTMEEFICVTQVGCHPPTKGELFPQKDLPLVLPLSLFTEGKAYTAQQNNLAIKLLGSARQKCSFMPHANLLNADLIKSITEQNKQEHPNIKKIAQEAKELQSKFSNDPLFMDNRKECSPQTTLQELGKEETKLFFELLDLCLLINTDDLEQQDVTKITTELNTKIETLDLQLLTKILDLTHVYDAQSKHKEKNIILQSSLTSAFLKKIAQTHYKSRSEFINLLNLDLQKNILLVFVIDKKLNDRLNKQHSDLKDNSIFKDNNRHGLFYKNALSYNLETEEFNNKELTLEKALLIDSILNQSPLFQDEFITNELVTPMVKTSLYTCHKMRTLIASHAADEQKKQIDAENKRIIEQAIIKLNSYPERFKRLVTSITPTSANLKRARLAGSIIAYFALASFLIHKSDIITRSFNFITKLIS